MKVILQGSKKAMQALQTMQAIQADRRGTAETLPDCAVAFQAKHGKPCHCLDDNCLVTAYDDDTP